jgi:hypothetical protein
MTMSKSSVWFLAKFLAAAGVLFWLWSQGGWWEVWGRMVLSAVAAVSPWITGYQLETQAGGTAFVGGPTRLVLPLNLRETGAGLIPFLALIAATAERSAGSRLKGAAVGIAAQFPVQVAVVTMTPLMMTPHAEWVSHLLDVFYTFAALGGLVALPLFLWWVWWKIGEPEGRGETAVATARRHR